MTLKSKLRLIAIAPFLLALVVGVLELFAGTVVGQAEESRAVAETIRGKVISLNVLTREYVTSPDNPRVLGQRNAVIVSLTESLSAAQHHFGADHHILDQLAKSHGHVIGFIELLDERQTDGAQPPDDAWMATVTGRLFVETGAMASAVSRLVRESNAAIADSIRLVSRLTLLLILALGGGVCVVALTIARSIADSVEVLRHGTEKLAEGRLDHRLPVTGEAEFRSVGASFNAMTEQLQEVVRLARAISRGDYARSLVPKGDTDELGNALASMTAGLRRHAELEAAYKAQLEEKNEELEVQAKDLRRFAFVASHDLQEPLRKVETFTNLLTRRLGADLDDTAANYMDRMVFAVGRMRTLIDDLLALSRMANADLAFTPVELASAVRRAVRDLDVSIAEANAEIRIGELPTVEADRGQMERLFQNLISNSVKYRRPDASLIVEVRWARGEGERPGFATVEVEDNGIGFDPQYADKIFAPFQRLHSRREYEGTGIGLALCQRIVQRHRGELTASAETGAGAIFRVTLPLLQPKVVDPATVADGNLV